jgi:hypothetical protein
MLSDPTINDVRELPGKDSYCIMLDLPGNPTALELCRCRSVTNLLAVIDGLLRPDVRGCPSIRIERRGDV